jgi:uncharacterized protein YcgL (UPF0745 family)
MRVLILNSFLRLKREGFNKVWETLEQDGIFWLQLEAEQDLIDNGIEYTIGEIEIKQDIK